MRQLIIALFLVVLTAIGSYYLITQKLNLNRYYPPDSIPFPQLHLPRALPSITPGPKLTALPGFASTPTPRATVLPHSGSAGIVPHTQLRPLVITPPTAPAVTPLPAPAYHAQTPLPMVPQYPSIV